MGGKVDSLLNLKSISDDLSLSLSTDEVIKIVVEKTFDLFGGEEGDNRVLLYMLDESRNELSLLHALLWKERKASSLN